MRNWEFHRRGSRLTSPALRPTFRRDEPADHRVAWEFVSLLLRPDKVESLDAFRIYIAALCDSLDQALTSPLLPLNPVVDHQGVEWQNTTLASFRLAMDVWLQETGWTAHDRRESAAWDVLALTEDDATGDKGALREYLADVRDRASSASLPDDWHWKTVAQTLAAGRERRMSKPGV